jgi:hypothetical protein
MAIDKRTVFETVTVDGKTVTRGAIETLVDGERKETHAFAPGLTLQDVFQKQERNVDGQKPGKEEPGREIERGGISR